MQLVREAEQDVALLQAFLQLPWAELAWSLQLVARLWRQVGSSQELWETHRCQFWAGKVFIPGEALRLRQAGQAFKAFRFAWVDRLRERITLEELCSLTWSHRMKAAAGEICFEACF